MSVVPQDAPTASSPKPIHVAIITDKRYLPWCATAIASCVEATGAPDLRIHLGYGDDIGVDDRARLRAMADVMSCAIDLHPLNSFATPFLSGSARMQWARCILPDLLPDLDRVIYLDADTFVAQSVKPLWELSLAPHPLAAVTNVTAPDVYPQLRQLGIQDPRSFFNSGVLVIDLKRWRAENVIDQLVEFFKEHSRLRPWHDQSGLNVVFAGRWKALHPRWNSMNSLRVWRDLAVGLFGEVVVDEAILNPGIIHFEGEGALKPWHYLCEHEWRGAYLATLARTPWRDEPAADRTITTVLTAGLPGFARRHVYRLLRSIRSLRGRGVRYD